MAEKNFEAGKRALSSSAIPQPLNKKSNLEYIVNPDGPSFPFTLIRKRQACSRGPSPGRKLTPPPMKRQPTLQFVTVESVPDSPRIDGSFTVLPSGTPSLEASPAGAAAWGRRTTGQKSKDRIPAAFGSHHCSHPAQMGPAMVSRTNSPGLGPVRSLNTAEGMEHRLLPDPADLGKPIRYVCDNKFNAKPTSYNVDIGNQPIKLWAHQDDRGPAALPNSCNLNQPIKLHTSQDAREQHTLYNPCNLAQPINSSGATCNSMHMAPSKSSNLNEPITPDNAMEIDSPNVLFNNCNLHRPITPDNTMEIDSPNASYKNCNLNEPIKSRPARNDKTHHAPDKCCNLKKPIRPCVAMETDTPNVSNNNCNSDEPTRSGAAGANYTHTILSQPIRYKNYPNWLNQFSSDSSEPMDTFQTPPEWFDPFWMTINQPKMNGKPQITLDVKQPPSKSGKRHQGNTQSDGPKERPGLSAVRILRQLMMTISLEDLCTESPKFCQKMHQAISALRPRKYKALFLTGTGAPRTTGTVNGIHTSIILDGSAYSNIISKMFLESLPWPEVTLSDISFILANGSCKTALGKAIKLRLWLGGVFSVIKAAIFDHDQYTLLLGRKTMSGLSVTTWFVNNSWTLEHNNELIDLKVTFDSPTGPSFLCKPLAAQIKDNT
ncbi:hypothetical protein DSO57_1018663 [Entomophthora muscae]|uniref:Uncharacterized protein n=1 Tax=Entomophthora muscae TaxID=34485 RepID=A0ACC2U2N7_9FUNG|nr:hypothetical protein DSO57_1018663 [Entomophthora muscae]